MQPHNLSNRAYDNSKRETLGKIWLNITTGPVERRVRFHVIDIKPTFNLLLGRPWLHELGVVPSTLHQKVKFILEGEPITIDASPMRIEAIEQAIIHVEHDENDEDLWSFTVAVLEEDRVPFDFHPHSNLVVNALL